MKNRPRSIGARTGKRTLSGIAPRFLWLALSGLIFAGGFSAGTVTAQTVALDRARETFQLADRNYERVRSLRRAGSVGAAELRSAEYERSVAKIDYWILADPENEHALQVEKARLNLEYRLRQYEVLEGLRISGSVSALDVTRARTRLTISRMTYDSIRDFGDAAELRLSIAGERLKLARRELSIARKLAASRSIAGRTLEIYEERFRDRERELDEAKEMLTADAPRTDF